MTTDTSSYQNIAQKRAAFALTKIRPKGKDDKALQKQLRSYIHSLPAMIQMNGYGQAIAFYKAKSKARSGEQAYKLIYDWLQEWLIGQEINEPGQELIDSITTQSMLQYQLATVETQAILVWMKKFAQAYLQSEKEDSKGATK